MLNITLPIWLEMSASVKPVNSSTPAKTYGSSSSSSYSPVVRSMSVKPSLHSPRPDPSTPRSSGQRFLPETPKSNPTAVPPIYANVHSQLSSGNNRQMTPAIAKLLEDTKKENAMPSHPRDPPAVPKPAARMSLRQKVHKDPDPVFLSHIFSILNRIHNSTIEIYIIQNVYIIIASYM